MDANTFCTWVSENFTEDNSKELRLCNITLQSILEKASNIYPNVASICSEGFLFQMLQLMFPNVKKSQKKENGTRKMSVIGIKLDTNPNPQDLLTKDHFLDLSEAIPPTWMVLKKGTSITKLCKYSDELVNGNPVQTQLLVDNDGSFQVLVAGKRIDMSEFLIRTTVVFNKKSVSSMFRCLNTFTLCKGFAIEKSEHDTYTTSKKAIKEIQERCDTKSTTYIIRHINCTKGVPLTSISKCCVKCLTFKRYRKHYASSCSEKKITNPNDSQATSSMDITQKLKQIAPHLNENQITLMSSQIQASECKSSKGMRWPKEVISMTLTLYNRNPAAYRDVTQNGWLGLPSESLLQLYKNAVKQRPGIIPDMMSWMYNEAVRQNIPKEGFYGGILFDEMSIQEDIQLVRQGKDSTLVGLVDCEPEVTSMHNMDEGGSSMKLADHVMQYVFHGISGFRWPFANYPNTQAPPADIFVSTWKCVDALYEWSFKPIYCCMDGSSNNRAFLKMHFPDDLLSTNMVASHDKNPNRKLIFIMDPCHLIKKIRNSILSSGVLDTHQRLLTVDGYTLTWQMWIDAYQWDRNTHSFPIHHKLTDEHLFPNGAQKMRNKLAFEALDGDMLHLMKTYQRSLSNNAGQIALTAVIQLLEHTSVLVSFFTDVRPLKDLCDERITKLTTCYNWFKSWETQISQSNTISKRYKQLITMETREDLDFMYHGFMSLVKMCIEDLHTELVPARVNSDIIENVFCQQRGLYHGANTHPTYNSFRTGINSIVLGQASISRKSNSGNSRLAAQPFNAERPRKKLRI